MSNLQQCPKCHKLTLYYLAVDKKYQCFNTDCDTEFQAGQDGSMTYNEIK